MPKRVKKTVTKKPVVEVRVDPLPTVLLHKNTVVEVDSKGVAEVIRNAGPAPFTPEVDSKGVGDVVEGPFPVGVEAPGGDMAMPEPAPDHVVAEREDDMKILGDQAELIRMAARIAELEDDNKKLAALPQPAAQGQIVTRKNEGEDIVQRTSGGNKRVTHDPSPQLRAEMATQEVKS